MRGKEKYFSKEYVTILHLWIPNSVTSNTQRKANRSKRGNKGLQNKQINQHKAALNNIIKQLDLVVICKTPQSKLKNQSIFMC